MNGPPTTGSILQQTFALYFANFATFFTLCALILSPWIAHQLYAASVVPDLAAAYDDPGAVSPEFPGGGLLGTYAVGFVLQLILPYIATGAMVYGVFQQVRNRRATLGECLSVGFRRFLPVLVLSLLIGFAMIIGVMLCIVPGILVYVYLAMSVPAVVIERNGLGDALNRSVELGRGYRWTVFGVLFGLGLLVIGISFGVGMVVAAAGGSLMLQTALSLILTVLWTGVQAAAITLLYYRLRREKESVDADQIAEVFA